MSLVVTRLCGTGATRGEQLGRAHADLLGRWLAAWMAGIERAGILDARTYLAWFLAETDHRAAIEAHVPDLMDEVAALARAADLPPDLLLAAQLMDEEWVFRGDALALARPEKCSSFAIRTGPGRCWAGQNMDLDDSSDGYQRLLHLSGDGPETLVFTIGGMIGLMGVNAQSLAVCVNALPELPNRRTGLPVAFMIRALLRCCSVEDARARLLALPHATSQHYLLADAHQIASYEATPDGVRRYEPEDPGRVLHTNHALIERGAIDPARLADSTSRLEQLQTSFADHPTDLADFQAMLSSCDPHHPICKTGDRKGGIPGDTIGFTIGSIISRLEAGRVESWISAGPPALRGYQHFSLALSSGA